MLVRLHARPGEDARPEGGRILVERHRRRRIAQADVADDHLAAQAAARLQHVGELLAVEGHRQGAGWRVIERPRPVPGQARRQVDADDRNPGRLGRPQRRLRRRLQRLGEPGPEQGVDHEFGARAGVSR